MANCIAVEHMGEYGHIYAVRQDDGMRVVAKRTVVDEHTPILWEVSVRDKTNRIFYAELPHSEGVELAILQLYTTSELQEYAQERGYGDWYPLPESLVGS
ncbi:MAG TPA: hypothetical protein VF043_12990 [Ktedonobacteraceae bacterium]